MSDNVTLHGLLIKGATENVNLNVTYTVLDPVAEANARVWRNVKPVPVDSDPTVFPDVFVLHTESKGWIVCSTPEYTEESTIYAQESTADETVLSVEKSPWEVIWDKTLEPGLTVDAIVDSQVEVSKTSPVTSTDADGTEITTVKITYYNKYTKERFNITDVERKDIYKRYDAPILTLGNIYRFSFVKDFEDLGYISDTEDKRHSKLAGIYRVDKILSYSDLVAGGIDLYTNLYAPSNVSTAVYQRDEPTFKNTTFYKLVDPRNEDVVFYMPVSFIDGSPDGSVAKYSKLLLTIDLGIHSDTELLVDMLDIIGGLLEARWGINAESVYGIGSTEDIVQFQTYDSVWLTTEDYELLNDFRKHVRETSVSTVLAKLCDSELNKFRDENLRLSAQVDAYEANLTGKSK